MSARYKINIQQAYRSTGFFVGKTQTPDGYTYTITDTETGEIVKAGRAFGHKSAVWLANKIVARLDATIPGPDSEPGSTSTPSSEGPTLTDRMVTSNVRMLRERADKLTAKGKTDKADKLLAKADKLEQTGRP